MLGKELINFLQLFLVHSERNLHTVLRPQINYARTNQTFSPHFILRLKPTLKFKVNDNFKRICTK